MELIVQQGPGRGLRHWLWSLLGEVAWLGLFHEPLGRDDDRSAPAVVARTVAGERHVLLGAATNRQAMRARDRFQRELDASGESEFGRRYGLPEAPESEER